MKMLTVPPSVQLPAVIPRQRNESFYIILFLAAIIALKLGLAYSLWRSGYIEYDADGFTRSVRAWEWHNGTVKLEVDAWLPLQFWLNGSLMNLWPDLLRVPRAVNLLCSIGTTINFFFIGRFLFGRINGYATALLTALFPWEIWFGLSGMSESLTHFFLSLGLVFLVGWLRDEKAGLGWLVAASIGFLGATMLRYEAWFYSAVYLLLVGVVAWRRHGRWQWQKWGRLALALAPAFSFIVFWMVLSWLDPRLNSPLGFARLTSEINQRIYGAENNTGLLARLFYYPQILLGLMYQLSIPAILGSLWLVVRPVKGVRPYLALVWGELALFILTTLPYNNIAPGSARYPVSNLLLLLPVVVYLFQLVFEARNTAWRIAGIGLFGALAFSLAVTTLSRPLDFPDTSTRQTATWLTERWNEGYLGPDEKVVLHLPAADGDRANEFTRAYYALRVLTNHPGNFEVIADTEVFGRLTQDEQGYAPHVWVHLSAASGAINYFSRNYRDVTNLGDYWVARWPLFRRGTPTPERGNLGQTYQFQADEFNENERTAMWISGPNGKIVDLGNKRADQRGVLTMNYTAQNIEPGEWTLTIVGQDSRRRALVRFFVLK